MTHAATHGPDGASSPAQGRDEYFRASVVGEIGLLYRVAVQLTRDPVEAEDLVQETLLRAYRGLEHFDGRHLRAWLLTIERRAHLNHVRKRRPLLLADGESAERFLEQAGPAAPSSEEVALSEEFEPVIAQSLADLPEPFREAIELVDIEGLSYAQAADRLGVPKGTVMSRLHRGRRRIRAALDKAGLVPRPRRTR